MSLPPSVTTRTNSGGFNTQDGTIHISKPFRSRKTNKLKAIISFQPRTSHFDTSNTSSGRNEFRGFFSLFWISMFLFTIGTYVRSVETHGHALNLNFASSLSSHAITLALSDAVLVLSTGVAVPFALAIKKGWIKYYWTGLFLQHVFQTMMLGVAITWTFDRKWPWVQSGFFTLHTLVMIMKTHSYLSLNGQMHYSSIVADTVYEELQSAVTLPEIGGREKALDDAITHRLELNAKSTVPASSADSERSTPSLGTPQLSFDGSSDTTQTTVDAETANTLRRRLVAVVESNKSKESNTDNSTPNATTGESPRVFEANILLDHPSSQIADLAKEFIEVDSDLVSVGPGKVRWPENITVKNFAVYMLIPSLVYELEFPRTNRIRPLYLFEKTTATFGTFALLYTVTESFILPLTPTANSNQTFWRSLLDLALPFMIAYLLLFYIIFECICNGFAELSYYADRQFYEDWWNSTSWDEFARKWNRPVHTFLLRHVYASTIASFKVSRTTAMLLTFLLSACAHELVMAVVTQKFRMYLFVLQLIQLPLIALGRLPIIKQNKLMGNVVFWLGLYAGFPLLCVAYVAY